MIDTSRKVRRVRSTDGTQIAIEEGGSPEGRPVVLLHGIAQSRHVWKNLMHGRLGRSRVLTVDLRGHGDSEAPLDRDAYGPGRLGADLRAVLEGLERPVVIAWSYAGVALGEYLRAHGGQALGGVVLLGAATCVGKSAREWFGAAMMDNARALMAEDAATYELGARAFLEACPATPLPAAFVDDAFAQMLRVSAPVRRGLLSRSEDFIEEIVHCEAPVAVLHGASDPVVLPSLGRRTRVLRPDAHFVELEGVGHLPWLEAPAQFDAALGPWLELRR